ncbi:hypothetical protein EMPS_00113 [Entomortierella parvispora]|uniref:NACHT domain-containing protein n=1 Tax=Entomortierella parvispora TaxID=205924 RepID=A0A9P3GZR3_9FUNG|nr:hypothetical protein EMPS_00113 [Entomortierella parvispora]
MLRINAQEAIEKAKACTEEARKARGSEHKVLKHYRNAKHALVKVNAMTADMTDLEEMIVVYLDLAMVLDSSGKNPQEKAIKCRQKADALRQARDERMRIHDATIAPSFMGPGFSPAIAQGGVAHWNSSATKSSTAAPSSFFTTSAAKNDDTALAPRQPSHHSSQSAISIAAVNAALGCPSFFSKNVKPEPATYSLARLDEPLQTIHQLAYCLALLQPSVEDDDLSAEALKWRLDTLNNSDEKTRLESMAVHVLELFSEDTRKDSAAVAEVVQLAPVLNRDHSRFLIKTFIDTLNKSEMMDLDALYGLAKAILGATPGSINSDDLETILQCLKKRLRPNRSAEHLYPLLLATSRVLDAMVDAHIGNIDRINLHGPLTEFLRDSESSDHPYLTFQVKYAAQALLNISDDEDIWHAGFRRFWLILNIGAGLVKLPDPKELKETLESLEKLYKAGKSGIGNLKATMDSAIKGNGTPTFTVKEGLKFRSAWYRAIRKAESYIETGRLVEFRTLVTTAPCRHDLMFQWGICQLLGQFVTDSRWGFEVRQEAVAFIGVLYKDISLWDRKTEVDQVIFDMLTIVTSRNDAHFEAANTLLEEIRKQNTNLKAFADHHSPIWIKFMDLDSNPTTRLLKAVQDRYVRHVKIGALPDNAPIPNLGDIHSALRIYHEPDLSILRVSGDELDLESCFVNLAIVGAPEHRQKEKEDLQKKAATFHRMTNTERVLDTDTQSLIPLEQLFSKRRLRDGREDTPNRILVQGRAGIGKSTLCKKLVHAHQNGLWRDLFDVILRLPLRNLKGLKSRSLEKLFLEKVFIAQDLHQEQVVLAKALAFCAQKGKVLFILDGLDEIVTDTGGDESDTFRPFLKMLLGQQHVIITSRPSGLDRKLLPTIDLELETVGFSQQNVKDFVLKVLDPEPARRVQEFIQQTPLIQGLVNIPVQLDVICYSWDSLPGDGMAITMTGLYQLMVRKLWCKDALRLKKTAGGMGLTERQIHDYEPEEIDELMATELQHLGYLAFKGMTNQHQIEFEEKDLRSAFRDLKDSTTNSQQLSPTHLVEAMKETSFLHTADSTLDLKNRSSRQAWHFLHLTFQEFFAATWIVRHFQPQQPCSAAGMMTTEEMTAFLHRHKYNPQYEIDDDEDEYVRSSAVEELGLESPLPELAIHPLITALNDDNLTIQWSAVETLRDYHSSLPESVIQFLISKFKDDDIIFRSSAVSILCKQSALPESAIQSLIATFKDDKKFVRSSAASALDRQSSLPTSYIESVVTKGDDWNIKSSAALILRGQSSLPKSSIESLIAALKDKDKKVRSSAASALGKQSSLSASAIQSLVTALKDDDKKVRSSAASALGNQSSLPKSSIESLIAALKDKDKNVRSSAAEALGKQSSLSASAIQSLVTTLKDDDKRVRSSAASALGNHNSLSESAIQSLIAKLKDDECDVRSSVVRALGRHSSLSEPAVHALVTALKDDKDVRSSAAEALGKQSSLSESVIQSLMETLKDDDKRVRSSAALILGKQSSLPESTIQFLIATLKNDNEQVRTSVALALGKQPSLPESAIQALIAGLKDDDWEARSLSASILSDQPSLSESAVQSLISALKDHDMFARSAAVSASGRQSSIESTAIRSLVAMVNEDEKKVPSYVSEILGCHSPSLFRLLPILSEDEIFCLFNHHLFHYSCSNVMSLQACDNGLCLYTEQGELQLQLASDGSNNQDRISSVFKAVQQMALYPYSK